MFLNFIFHILSLLGLCSFAKANLLSPSIESSVPSIVRVHIFVHGTYMPGFIFFDPRGALKHNIGEQSYYVKALKSVRSKELASRRQLLLGQGLQEIDDKIFEHWEQKNLPTHLKHKAAVPIIVAYDQFVDKDGVINKYFTYGWLGVLDDDYRCAEAKNFYLALDSLHSKLQKEYPENTIEFILNGHSHGGNLILYLAKYEHEYKKQLPIYFAGLYATPIQQETVNFCRDPLFKNIFLVYSNGDIVQNNDRFSTKTKISYRKFTDLISLEDAPNNIYQVCVCAHNKSTVFGHQSMFCFDSYYQLVNRVHRSTNAHRRAVNALSPLPLVTFSPIIMRLLSGVPVGSMKLSVEYLSNTCFFAISENNAYAQSEDILPKLTHIKRSIKNNW